MIPSNGYIAQILAHTQSPPAVCFDIAEGDYKQYFTYTADPVRYNLMNESLHKGFITALRNSNPAIDDDYTGLRIGMDFDGKFWRARSVDKMPELVITPKHEASEHLRWFRAVKACADLLDELCREPWMLDGEVQDVEKYGWNYCQQKRKAAWGDMIVACGLASACRFSEFGLVELVKCYNWLKGRTK